jgi:DNA gyrase subunit A
MARQSSSRRTSARTTDPAGDLVESIIDVDVSEEMRTSFLEYAYSVIYSRAIPDARDGLKPVQRRILFQMREMGLRPDRGHVKCARIVGDVMGRLHPHGDQAIYDTLVRLAQPWVMSVPMVDGHGNFGNADDGPAAYRYTEARLAEPAMLMTESIDEDVVDMVPNYDGRELQPDALPAAWPNLLVNGATGIAVGMATNMPPHNLGEVVAAARHLISHPDADLAALTRFVPGPDLPTGGTIVGLDGIREAYASGRGSFRTRATTSIETVSARRRAIVVTALPYNVGPEKVREKIADLVRSKKLTGISGVEDHTDREHGLRLVIEIKSGFNAERVRDELFRLTQLEESFSINNVALVDGRPQTLGLKQMLEVYLRHRLEVVRRRSEFRRNRRSERLHLVEGLMIALLDIDEVIAVIRSSDDAASARQRLQAVFDLTEIQAQYILDTPLRRLTRYDQLELERERDSLRGEIDELTLILDNDSRLREVVSSELADVARRLAAPRRTILLESDGVATGARPATADLQEADTDCWVLLSTTGRIARTPGADLPDTPGSRSPHDAIASQAPTTSRGEVGVVTSHGRLHRLVVVDLPTLPQTAHSPSLAGAVGVGEFVDLAPGERPLAVTAVGEDTSLALGTRSGVVKRVSTAGPTSKEAYELIRLEDGDEVVGAMPVLGQDDEVVFVTTDAQALRFPARKVRQQGRSGGGVAGIALNPGATVLFFGVTSPDEAGMLLTVAGSADALPGTQPGTVKISSLSEVPAKGRATRGVRCHGLRAGEDGLLLAWVGPHPLPAERSGEPVELDVAPARRDATGSPAPGVIAAVGSPARSWEQTSQSPAGPGTR